MAKIAAARAEAVGWWKEGPFANRTEEQMYLVFEIKLQIINSLLLSENKDGKVFLFLRGRNDHFRIKERRKEGKEN